MRQNTKVIIMAALISMAIAGTVFAMGDHGQGGRCDRDRKGGMERMAKELNLTPDQEARLKSAKEARRAQMETLRVALKEKRQALKDNLSKPGVTRQAIEPLVAEIKGLEASMIEQRVDGIFEVKGILTPEQFNKLQARKPAKHGKGKMEHCMKGW